MSKQVVVASLLVWCSLFVWVPHATAFRDQTAQVSFNTHENLMPEGVEKLSIDYTRFDDNMNPMFTDLQAVSMLSLEDGPPTTDDKTPPCQVITTSSHKELCREEDDCLYGTMCCFEMSKIGRVCVHMLAKGNPKAGNGGTVAFGLQYKQWTIPVAEKNATDFILGVYKWLKGPMCLSAHHLKYLLGLWGNIGMSAFGYTMGSVGVDLGETQICLALWFEEDMFTAENEKKIKNAAPGTELQELGKLLVYMYLRVGCDLSEDVEDSSCQDCGISCKCDCNAPPHVPRKRTRPLEDISSSGTTATHFAKWPNCNVDLSAFAIHKDLTFACNDIPQGTDFKWAVASASQSWLGGDKFAVEVDDHAKGVSGSSKASPDAVTRVKVKNNNWKSTASLNIKVEFTGGKPLENPPQPQTAPNAAAAAPAAFVEETATTSQGEREELSVDLQSQGGSLPTCKCNDCEYYWYCDKCDSAKTVGKQCDKCEKCMNCKHGNCQTCLDCENCAHCAIQKEIYADRCGWFMCKGPFVYDVFDSFHTHMKDLAENAVKKQSSQKKAAQVKAKHHHHHHHEQHGEPQA